MGHLGGVGPARNRRATDGPARSGAWCVVEGRDSRRWFDGMSSPFAFLDRPTDATVLVDAAVGRVWTQTELADAVDSFGELLVTGKRELVFCLCGRDVASVVGYLSAVRAGHAVALLDAAARPQLTEALIDHYSPALVVHSDDGQTPAIRQGFDAGGHRVADELAVLLSTSGTTGSPKLVRLARRNIDANASSIAQYLEIGQRERTIQSLPIHYSYGLSVLHSHLAAGASVILTPHSIMRPEFWADAGRWQATSFAGVPHSYAILERTGLLRKAMPDTMRTLTQAGGRLPPESIVQLHELMSKRGGRLWVMYGQTEATARISYVPPDALPEKAHTIGIPIPGGRLSIRSGGQEIAEPDVEGELIYQGPNVMLGYAESQEDLVLGDAMNGTLHTGDLGSVDNDGFFRLTGRTKRIAKVYGLRVNLDEIEAAACVHGPVALVDGGEQIIVWREAGAEIAADDLRREIAGSFGLNSHAFAVRDIDSLPLKASGKVDYDALAKRSAY
jgi:long-chain acyl-CoA synthetase